MLALVLTAACFKPVGSTTSCWHQPTEIESSRTLRLCLFGLSHKGQTNSLGFGMSGIIVSNRCIYLFIPSFIIYVLSVSVIVMLLFIIYFQARLAQKPPPTKNTTCASFKLYNILNTWLDAGTCVYMYIRLLNRY
jgi:hypothetical protein